MSENEEKKKESINIDSNQINKEKNNDFDESSENESDKEEPNFESIDFNINPFNSNTDNKQKEQDDNIIEQKDEDKTKFNNNIINNMGNDVKLNNKPNISNNFLY
jgi:hypothetical protein